MPDFKTTLAGWKQQAQDLGVMPGASDDDADDAPGTAMRRSLTRGADKPTSAAKMKALSAQAKRAMQEAKRNAREAGDPAAQGDDDEDDQ